MRLSLVKLVAGAFLLMSVFTVGSVSVVFGQETDDPVKIEIYTRFYNNRENNKGAAYQAARA